MQAPFGYRVFQKLLTKTGVSREDERGILATAMRCSVILGVYLMKGVRSIEFPARGTGGWWWLWRWKFEFLMNWFEWESLVWTRRVVEPGMTVLDVGAHVGYYSRYLSRLVGPAGKVYAFEASPENRAILERNLRRRRYANVEIVPYAVSDREGKMNFYVARGHSNHSLIQGYSDAETVLEVPAISIDAFTAQRGIQSVGFVKMDVEGGESMALQGMRETVRKCPGLALLVECSPYAVESAGTTPQKFLDLIRDIDLDPAAILADATLGPIPEELTTAVYINLLCRKRATG